MSDDLSSLENKWNSISAWGPTALLPIFQLLGTAYSDARVVTHYLDKEKQFDGFTKIDFVYPEAVASIKVAKAAKSEGELIITGTKGYVYVPAPWWKTDYFEIRYENPSDNKRAFTSWTARESVMRSSPLTAASPPGKTTATLTARSPSPLPKSSSCANRIP